MIYEFAPIEIEFEWKLDDGGDWQLSYTHGEVKAEYWGIVCPHFKHFLKIVWDGDREVFVTESLEATKDLAQRLCVLDIYDPRRIKQRAQE